ncbi:ElyC/SanA/YdcF family protein [Photobacterium swingsii]|uniref:ElyC/SanA/YdcF family protein n=1 Tax=Photobacterium swingsii TaxID=680026 RepID=UPI00406775CA
MIKQLIESAFLAYRSPNRTHYACNQTVGSNLDAVRYYLEQAIDLNPKQTDLMLTLANMYSFQGDIEQALAIYYDCFMQTPQKDKRIVSLCYLIVWYHYLSEHKRVDEHLAYLSQISPPEARQVKQLLQTIERILAKPINYVQTAPSQRVGTKMVCPASSCLEDTEPQHKAIIILGYKLNDDGTVPPMLLERLKAALTVINASPEQRIFVTGGLAQAGVTEAVVMQQWLIANQVAADRITLEDKATNTLDNTAFTLAQLQHQNIEHAYLVSASIHVHRCEIIFAATQLHQQFKKQQAHTLPRLIHFDHFAANDGLSPHHSPEGKVRLDCYIDALRSFGLPAFCTKQITQA